MAASTLICPYVTQTLVIMVALVLSESMENSPVNAWKDGLDFTALKVSIVSFIY